MKSACVGVLSIIQDACLFIFLVMYLFFFTYRRFQLMLYSMGGQLDGLREPPLGGNLGDSHMSACHVKRMAATLRTV